MIRRLLAAGWRFWFGLTACACLAVGLAHPRWPVKQAVFRYLFVLDISQSMNAQDYRVDGMAPDRLGFAKASIRHALYDLPCGSEAGLAIFTTQTVQILIEPVDVCAHFPVLADTLEHIDWRMAWAMDSHVAFGLFAAIRELTERGTAIRLAFFSDGEQFPPGAQPPYFDYERGKVRGLIVGVGGSQPVPIPRLDRENRPQGFWEYVDLKDFLPPGEIPQRRDGPNLYLSRLDEAALRALAQTTGLEYHRLVTPEALSAALSSADLAEDRPVSMELNRWLGVLALVLCVATYWADFRISRMRGDRASR
jgi:mxaL protein